MTLSRFPAEVCERMKRNGGPVFPMRTLLTQMARSGLSANENGDIHDGPEHNTLQSGRIH
jgi:hypothetical protein